MIRHEYSEESLPLVLRRELDIAAAAMAYVPAQVRYRALVALTNVLRDKVGIAANMLLSRVDGSCSGPASEA